MSSAELNRQAFELDHPHRMASLVRDRIHLTQLGHEISGLYDEDLISVCAACGYDVGILVSQLAAVPAASWDNSRSWIPWDLIIGPGGIALDREDRSAGDGLIADPHLHSGAALSLRLFCSLLVSGSGSLQPSVEGVYSTDARGNRFDVCTLIHAIRHQLQFVGTSPNARYQRTFFKELDDGSFWRLTRAAVLSDEPDEFVRRLLINDGPADPEAALAWIAREISSCNPAAVPIFSALCLLNHELRSMPNDNLSRFVDRFDQMGLLRDSTLANGRAEIVAQACEVVMPSDAVVAAEFRKTVAVGRNGGSPENKLRLSLLDHLDGFVRYSSTSGRSPRLSMPVTFLRQRANDGVPNSDELLSHYRLRAIWAVYAGIVNFSDAYPSMASYITALDVVGNEISTSNWPFVAIYSDALARPSLQHMSLTAHAGEFFRWRMEGLRSIGQLLLPNTVVSRIGHALALDDELPIPAFRGSLTVRDLVEDLCWLFHADVRVSEVEAHLERVLTLTNLGSYGVAMSHILDAWLVRRSLTGLEAQALIGSDVRSSNDWPAEVLPLSAFVTRPDRRALISLIYKGPGPLGRLDAPIDSVSNKVVRDYLDWSDGIGDEVSHLLGEHLRQRSIVVESCPTSNVALSGIASFDRHPISRFVARDLVVSISSDDPMIFGTDVVEEARMVGIYFGDAVRQSVSATSLRSCCPQSRPLDREHRGQIRKWLRGMDPVRFSG
ncbi:hypothetical protein MED01_006585 [Micromonospora sp. MED01]|uniref:hypothetical protein n=1 Tax=Micromonospora alfalfae TaxID=2911212 RepID=UPI001EE98D16|nr:hypothetical protein [Micromonospora alfalfae]MCG5461718.1 hypothetical protein [Micromonospora alfalfae]